MDAMQWHWYDLYYQQLEALGYENDGEPFIYKDGTFMYCSDYSSDADVKERWCSAFREDWRIVAVYGFSVHTPEVRDDHRLAGLYDAFTREIGATASDPKFDRGHYIAHSLGGRTENGVFGQRRDINRPWSELGRLYRSMETYARKNPGTFVFSRPIHGDGSTHPFFFEYGILLPDWTWWVEVFPNRYTYTPYRGSSAWPEWYRVKRDILAERLRKGLARGSKRYVKSKMKVLTSKELAAMLPSFDSVYGRKA